MKCRVFRAVGGCGDGAVECLLHEGHEGVHAYDLETTVSAVHPIVSGNHERYARAVELVGACHGKYDLVDLVNYLLARTEAN